MVEKCIKEFVFDDKISLHEIKNHYCIDSEEAEIIMKKINDFVFLLYFNVNVDFDEKINISIDDNKFYKYLNINSMTNK